MPRTSSRVIALVAMLTCLSVAAQAVDSILTLACQGTTTTTQGYQLEGKHDPITMGIVVDFRTRTVHGFELSGVEVSPLKVSSWNEARVAFGGSFTDKVYERTFLGTIDRATGDVEATSTLADVKTGNSRTTSYSLKCKPAQRMF
jgi:hypothetical protein